MEIDVCVEELKKAILASPEYAEYRRLTAEIDKRPEVRRAIDSLRRENFAMQNSEGDIDPNTLEDYRNRFIEIRQQDYVDQYLLAEVTLCRMIRDINRRLVEGLEFDTSFLEN